MIDRVILDSGVSDRLQKSKTSLELCDEAGHTVGYFLPPALHRQFLYAWAKCQFTDEELDEARKEVGGLATADAIAYLNTLAKRCGTNP